MKRLLPLLVAAIAVAALVPAAASADSRMLVGFQDDPTFRWRDDRQTMLDRAATTHASVIRTTVYWSKTAPRRPANAANPFDKAYVWDDLDELARNAQLSGIELYVTIWGTPGWANGNKGENRLPTRLADLTNFARALATRYSGRYPAYPPVMRYSVWNEPNLEQFLAPQYDARGRDTGPQLYAKLYRAAYAGLKAGNRNALVAIGETSARGRDKSLYKDMEHGKLQETHSPGRFAELVAKTRPALKFDAWATHPYPTTPSMKPTQKVKWPNVTLTQLPRFETSLDNWFKRKNIPIWISEYGHETRPEEPAGVSYAAQAAYAVQALKIAQKDVRVKMFVWFVFRDNKSSLWQSGLLKGSGAAKPALARFSATARLLDVRSPVLAVKAGIQPTVALPAIELRARAGAGTPVGITYRVFENGTLVFVDQTEVLISADGNVRFPLGWAPEAGKKYTLQAALNTTNGYALTRTAQLVPPSPAQRLAASAG